MSNKIKKTNITLYSIQIPLLLISLILVGASVNAVSNKSDTRNVLAEEDSRDSEDKEDESKDEDQNEDQEDEDEKENKEEENSKKEAERQRESAKKEAEKTMEATRKSNTIRTTTTNTQKVEDENENEMEDTEDIEDEKDIEKTEKQEIVSTVTNEDGTITKTFIKTEGNEVEMRAYTYDVNGTLIKKAELNSDGTVKEEELVNEDEDNDLNNDDNNEVEIKFVPSADGTTNPALNSIIKAKLEQEIITNKELGTTVNKLELKIKTVDGILKYEGTAESTEKLLGVFDVQIATDVEVDPTTGNILSVNQNFWSKVLSFLSF